MEIHEGRKEQETKNHFVEKVFYILVFYLLWNSIIVLIKADLLYKI